MSATTQLSSDSRSGPPTPVRQRGPRILWRIVGTLATIFVLGMALLQLIGWLAYNTQDIERRVDATDLDSVSVDVHAGTVEVVGADTDTITLTATISSGISRTQHREQIDGSRYVVTADCPSGPASNHCDTEYRLEVPAALEVQIRVGDGSVVLRDLTGAVDARTSNSTIRAEHLSGPVVLHTSNDSIDATALASRDVVLESSNDRVVAEFIEPPDSVRITTNNDAVSVVVPDTDDSYAVRIRTSNGEQRTDIRTDPSSDRIIDIHTSNDDVVVSYPQD